jgi:hypothetical protein
MKFDTEILSSEHAAFRPAEATRRYTGTLIGDAYRGRLSGTPSTAP